MFYQLAIGSLVICLTIVVEGAFIAIATKRLPRAMHWLAGPKPILRSTVVIIAVTLWALLALSVAVWIWAGAFLVLEAFDTLETALYFSIVSFTTLGFGDIILPEETRLLSGMAAANGLIAFGLSTAFLVEYLRRLLQPLEKVKKA